MICCYLLYGQLLMAQEQNKSSYVETEGSNYTRAQVLKYPLISTAISVASVTGVGLIDSTDIANVDIPWLLSASIATQHLPMYQFNTRLGMRYSLYNNCFFNV